MQVDYKKQDQLIAATSGWLNWFLFYGFVFFFMGNLFAAIAVYPAYSLSIDSTPFQAGLQNTVFALSAVLMRFFLGPVMDHKGPRTLMLWGIFSFITAPLLLLVSDSYAVLLFARIYQALGLAVVLPGITTLVAEMSPQGKIGTYLGTTRIFINLAILAGPSTALLYIEYYGFNSWFVFSALTCLLSLLLLVFVKTPFTKTRAVIATGSWTRVKEAMAEKQIYPIIGGIALFSFTYSAVLSFAALHIEAGAAAANAAYFFVALGIAGIIACLAAGLMADRYGYQKIAWGFLAILGAGTILLAFIQAWPLLIIICGIVIGVGIQGSSLVFAAWLINICRPGIRATTISIQENTIDIIFALSALTFGLAAQGPGLTIAFLLTGLFTIAAIVPLLRKSAQLKVNSAID